MYPAGLTCRVGGRPDGGKDPTCPLWRGITTYIIKNDGSEGSVYYNNTSNVIIIIIIITALTENSASGIYSDPS